LAIVLIAVWEATQSTAWRLGFQPQLGRPWFELWPGIPAYVPPAFFCWWYAYDAYAPRIFLEGGSIAVSGGFMSIAVAIHVGVARQGDQERRDLCHGALATRRWSGPPDYLPRWCGARQVRARRSSPQWAEHVPCLAATRSRKGVGLMVQTLLTWPASAIVRDIKGENWKLRARVPSPPAAAG
jgi:type IV secretion system protein VirD4